MRKLETEMLKAIRQGRAASIGSNTRVEPSRDDAEVMRVYLHGHHIASVCGDVVTVNLCTLEDYPTPTTTSRLRALGVNVRVRQGTAHIDGQAIAPSRV